jgi:hypothetical protein
MSNNTNNFQRNFQINPFLGTEDILGEYKEHLVERTSHHFGYPYNLNFNFQELGDFLKYSINNLGDPFKRSNYGVHARQFEVQVLQYFAQLWKISNDDYWGVKYYSFKQVHHFMWYRRQFVKYK